MLEVIEILVPSYPGTVSDYRRAASARRSPVTVRSRLRPYLAFRHFFSHAYVIDTRADVLDPLVRNVHDTYALAREDLKRSADAR